MKKHHAHINDIVIFRDGYGGGLKDGVITMINLKGVQIKTNSETIFKKWIFIVSVKHIQKDINASCYALFNNHGRMRNCGMTITDVTNYFSKDEFTTDMYVSLWSADPEDRKLIFENNGWKVKHGTFLH